MGRKTINDCIAQVERDSGSKLSSSEKRDLEMMILSDDLFGSIKNFAKSTLPKVFNVAKPILSDMFPYMREPLN